MQQQCGWMHMSKLAAACTATAGQCHHSCESGCKTPRVCLLCRGHHLFVTTAESDMSYTAQAAARHQPPRHQVTAASAGAFSFVTYYPAPFPNMKEAITQSIRIEELANASPVAIVRVLQKILMAPCESLFANATAIKVNAAVAGGGGRGVCWLVLGHHHAGTPCTQVIGSMWVSCFFVTRSFSAGHHAATPPTTT